MSKTKRVSLSINTRLQPDSNTLIGEVAEWLNSHENSEKNRLISQALIMAYLPNARAEQGVDRAEIERCCWETQDMLDKHGFNLRQSLHIAQPQWRSASIHSMTPPFNSPSEERENDSSSSTQLESNESEDENDFIDSYEFDGEHSNQMSCFDDDD